MASRLWEGSGWFRSSGAAWWPPPESSDPWRPRRPACPTVWTAQRGPARRWRRRTLWWSLRRGKCFRRSDKSWERLRPCRRKCTRRVEAWRDLSCDRQSWKKMVFDKFVENLNFNKLKMFVFSIKTKHSSNSCTYSYCNYNCI